MSLVSPLKSTSFSKGSEWYEIAESYDSSVSGFAGDYEYYGYLNLDGGWIIQRYQITTGQYRYFQGRSDLPTNWTNKASLSYGAYNTLTVTNP